MDVPVSQGDSNTSSDGDSLGGRDFSVDGECQLWAKLEDSWDRNQGIGESGRGVAECGGVGRGYFCAEGQISDEVCVDVEVEVFELECQPVVLEIAGEGGVRVE